MSFVARLSKYTPQDMTKLGYYNLASMNPFVASGLGLPNCTAYAWGRFYEVYGDRPNLSTRNPKHWYQYNIDNQVYEYDADIPKLGALCCYDSSAGGHVCVVEQINKVDGEIYSIVTSESAWTETERTPENPLYFYTLTLYASNHYEYPYEGFTHQGFIYNPAVTEPLPPARHPQHSLPLIYYPRIL